MIEHSAKAQHDIHWKFFRAGGFDQVRLDSGQEICALSRLDQKLWAALSCPTRGLEFDPRTLDILDSDHDGRVRAAEVIAVVEWLGHLLKQPDILLKREDSLPLEAIDDSGDEGKAVLAAAKRILTKRGTPHADIITLADVTGVEQLFGADDFNGDGIVPAEIAKDDFLASVITDIIAALGGDTDRSGFAGVSQKKLTEFFDQAEKLASWASRANSDPALKPLGENSDGAGAAFAAVRAKIEDWFTRCALAAFDSRAAAPLNRSAEDWVGLAGHMLSPAEQGLAAFPLAEVTAGTSLPLRDGINPAWAEAISRFRQEVVIPLLGQRDHLTADEWTMVKHRFDSWRVWQAEKPAGAVGQLGVARIDEILHSNARTDIDELIARDLALAPEVEALVSVEKLLRCCRDLVTLLNNFVAFRDFYIGKHQAVFQAGTLFLDSRSCELCVRVEDPAKHATLAALSRIYLVYCECIRRGGGDKMFIAAAITTGDSDQLMLGRNGVFYDRKGGDWDATIVKIIDNPISIRQSFWAPYKKAAQLIGQQIDKFAAMRSAAISQGLAVAAIPVATPKPAAAALPPAPFDVGRYAGIFAAIGLAIGAIGTAVATVITTLLKLPWWQIPLAFVSGLLVISGPSMLIASIKLHRRNLGPILDANGWAVNTHARINIPFGATLTHQAKLPGGAVRSLTDPYAEKRPPWRLYLAIAIFLCLLALAWRFGLLAKVWAMV